MLSFLGANTSVRALFFVYSLPLLCRQRIVENMNQSNAISRAAALVALATLTVVGCGESKPSTYPVTGVVTFKGQPVEGATVGFTSTDPEIQPAIGVTDAQGKYTLTTFEKDDGALPGEFKVRVTKYDRNPTPAAMNTSGVDIEEMPDDYEPEAMREEPPPKHLLPEKYSMPHSTPLKTTVQAGENSYDIDLE